MMHGADDAAVANVGTAERATRVRTHAVGDVKSTAVRTDHIALPLDVNKHRFAGGHEADSDQGSPFRHDKQSVRFTLSRTSELAPTFATNPLTRIDAVQRAESAAPLA